MITVQDNRTPEEKRILDCIVFGHDTFMSGWGECENRPSYAGWACEAKHVEHVKKWVKNRGDIKRVRVVKGNFKPSAGAYHYHIYVVSPGHPALTQVKETSTKGAK